MSGPTVLLTGASGVVGRALLSRLPESRVICLVHRAAVPGTRAVRGDISSSCLGMDGEGYSRLAREVDVVVHCAAVTDFTADRPEVEAMNVTGTGQVLQFAQDAGAVLHHLSSAFIARSPLAAGSAPDATCDPRRYLDSKRAAETLVRASGQPATIVRPSIVIGDSATGSVARLQLVHRLTLGILRESLPFLPLRPHDLVDFVPQDHLAEFLLGLIEGGVRGGDFWVTAGAQALTAQEIVDLAVAACARRGRVLRPPRLVDRSMVDRLIRPAFIDGLAPRLRRRFDDLVAPIGVVAAATPLPSSVRSGPGATPLTHEGLRAAFTATVDHLLTRRPSSVRTAVA